MSTAKAAKTRKPAPNESANGAETEGGHRHGGGPSLLKRLVGGVRRRRGKSQHGTRTTAKDHGNGGGGGEASTKSPYQAASADSNNNNNNNSGGLGQQGSCEDLAVHRALDSFVGTLDPLAAIPAAATSPTFSSSSSTVYSAPRESEGEGDVATGSPTMPQGNGEANGNRGSVARKERDPRGSSPTQSSVSSSSAVTPPMGRAPVSQTAPATPSNATSSYYSSGSSSTTASSLRRDSTDDTTTDTTADAFSRASQRSSQAASSHQAEPGSPLFPSTAHPQSNGMVGANTHAPYGEDGVVFTQDHRSALVSTMDVEVLMAKRMMRRQQNAVYLQARWSHMRRAAAGQGDLYANAVARGVRLDPFGLPVNVELEDFYDVKSRTDTLYLRHMDSLVELYLKSDPKYAEALGRFNAHMPPDEQRLRTNDCLEAYARATRTAPTRQDGASRSQPSQGGGSSARASARGRDGVSSAGGGDHGGGAWWQLAGTDIELLGADAARRGRFADDTLPWRPLNFNALDIRLEPLEHHQPSYDDMHAADEPMTFTGQGSATGSSATAQPAVGGSVNLLLEVLILTETEPPYTSGVPSTTFTNMFILLASYFVLPDVLVCKFIRLFRSIRRWAAAPADCEDEHRPSYLMQRLIQCLLAYLRHHEMDLTVATLQRVAYFIETSGFGNPMSSLVSSPSTTAGMATGDGTPPRQQQQQQREPVFDVWPCAEGVYDVRRTAPKPSAAATTGLAYSGSHEGQSSGDSGGRDRPSTGTTGNSTSLNSRQSAIFYPSIAHLGHADGGGIPAAAVAGAGGASSAAASRARPVLPPLDAGVSQVFLELSLFVRQFVERHLTPLPVLPAYAAAPVVSRNAARSFSPWAHGLSQQQQQREDGPSPLRREPAGGGYGFAAHRESPRMRAHAVDTLHTGCATTIDSGAPRHRLGTMYTASAAARRAQAAAGFGVGGTRMSPNAPNPSGNGRGGGGGGKVENAVKGSSNRRLGTSAVVEEVDINGEDEDEEGDADVGGGTLAAIRDDDGEADTPHGENENGRDGADRTYTSSSAAPTSPSGQRISGSSLHTQMRPSQIGAERLSQQICLLAFSLFSAIHIRELLNNAWTDPDMRRCVSFHLHEFMEFNSRLQRWTAAVIVTPSSWADTQQTLRHLLEVCRRLYEQQNYQVASAVLGGLRHPAVEVVEKIYNDNHVEPLLSGSEQRELETLQELMNPFAVYSPSSLNSVTARAAGEMERAMIPLLSPILGVLFRTEESKGKTVTVRASDGQATVNWSKVMAIGKIIALWLRCQYTPYHYTVDPTVQEYLWSIRYHQWTDSMLIRVARRVKRDAERDTNDAADNQAADGNTEKENA